MTQMINNNALVLLGRDTVSELNTLDKSLVDDVEVCWLPSLPLTKKYKLPPIRGLGILYSEELDVVFHVFETSNLRHGIQRCCAEQTAALNIDPECRLYWLEVSNTEQRSYYKSQLPCLEQG